MSRKRKREREADLLAMSWFNSAISSLEGLARRWDDSYGKAADEMRRIRDGIYDHDADPDAIAVVSSTMRAGIEVLSEKASPMWRRVSSRLQEALDLWLSGHGRSRRLN